jgi:hypothetical protein
MKQSYKYQRQGKQGTDEAILQISTDKENKARMKQSYKYRHHYA